MKTELCKNKDVRVTDKDHCSGTVSSSRTADINSGEQVYTDVRGLPVDMMKPAVVELENRNLCRVYLRATELSPQVTHRGNTGGACAPSESASVPAESKCFS